MLDTFKNFMKKTVICFSSKMKSSFFFIHSSSSQRSWEDWTGNVYQALYENKLPFKLFVITYVIVTHYSCFLFFFFFFQRITWEKHSLLPVPSTAFLVRFSTCLLLSLIRANVSQGSVEFTGNRMNFSCFIMIEHFFWTPVNELQISTIYQTVL